MRLELLTNYGEFRTVLEQHERHLVTLQSAYDISFHKTLIGF